MSQDELAKTLAEYKFTIQINLQKNIPKMVKPNLKTI